MTVAVGLVCKDGVLVASDSMGSEGLIAVNSTKVRALTRCPVVWTAAGSVFTIEEVGGAFDEVDASGTATAPPRAFTGPDLSAIRSSLKAKVHAKMTGAYKSALSAVPHEGGMVPASFASTVLALGWANGTPWFLEFAPDGQLNWHTDHSFYATGSGGPFATVAVGLMRHYVGPDLSLEYGKLLAYRTIETVCEVSSGGVGLPVQIATCDDGGQRVLDTAELNQIKTSVDAWKTAEAETLRELGNVPHEAVGDLPSMGVAVPPPG